MRAKAGLLEGDGSQGEEVAGGGGRASGAARGAMKEHSVDQPPQLLAERILRQYGLANDDALVLVVRYVGET